MQSYPSPFEIVATAPPQKPMFCFRKERLVAAARWFLDSFPADPFYAIKANPSAHVIDTLWSSGLRKFDVASANECRLIAKRYPTAELAFLHPVKNRAAISEAYHYGVRTFVLDSEAEFEKIEAATGQASDLTLIVRIDVSNSGAVKPLAGKFGANEKLASQLLKRIRPHVRSLGVSFHVGSQAMEPSAWTTAISDMSRIVSASGVPIEILDVGGGFPSIYNMAPPPSMVEYARAIEVALMENENIRDAKLWCEPGRAMVADAESLLTKVELTKPGILYINDGCFGALYDVVHERWKFPARAISGDAKPLHGLVPYQIYGPTCDSADAFPTPLLLPDALVEGDYIEFGNLGAYGRSLASSFNGFGDFETVFVSDDPWPTQFETQTKTIKLNA